MTERFLPTIDLLILYYDDIKYAESIFSKSVARRNSKCEGNRGIFVPKEKGISERC